MKTILVALAASTMLIAGGASADHCEVHVAYAEYALDTAAGVEKNAFDAAEALLEHALRACVYEEEQMAMAELDSPMLDPDYVSVGQSMLINALELLIVD